MICMLMYLAPFNALNNDIFTYVSCISSLVINIFYFNVLAFRLSSKKQRKAIKKGNLLG